MDFVVIAGIIIIAYLVNKTECKGLKILCYIAMPIMGVLWEYISWPASNYNSGVIVENFSISNYELGIKNTNTFLPNLVKVFLVYIIIYYAITIKNKLDIKDIKLRYIFILVGCLPVAFLPFLGAYTHETIYELTIYELYHACIYDFPFIILLIVSFISVTNQISNILKSKK